jgi:hypothetical protein
MAVVLKNMLWPHSVLKKKIMWMMQKLKSKKKIICGMKKVPRLSWLSLAFLCYSENC